MNAPENEETSLLASYVKMANEYKKMLHYSKIWAPLQFVRIGVSGTCSFENRISIKAILRLTFSCHEQVGPNIEPQLQNKMSTIAQGLPANAYMTKKH